ncbi:unnamed protein product, partial [marine sediment metagenome]
MANGDCLPQVYLSSLDPGVGKTTALIHFIKQLVACPEHDEVGMLVCLSRIDEIKRLVKEADLDGVDFAGLTRNGEANDLSTASRRSISLLVAISSLS